MKSTLIAICLTVCMLSAFGLEEEKLEYLRSWSLADPLNALLLFVCVWQLATTRWRMDRASVFLTSNVIVLGLSGLLNSELGNGTLLNFGRTALTDAVLYLVMSNIIRNGSDLRRFSAFCVLCGVVAFGLSIPNLSAGWSGGFTSAVSAFGSIDLNSYGFLFVLLFCATAPLWLGWSDVIRGLLIGAGLACGALVSLSRSAWVNLLIAAAIIFMLREISASRGRITRVFTLLFALGLAAVAVNRFGQALPGVVQFGQAKLNDFGDDVVNTRVIALTLDPISNWITQPVSTLLFGDAVSFQHTFLANALWFTGIAGLSCGIGIYFSMLRTGWLAWRSSLVGEQRLAAACFLAIVAVMVLDDSATNHRYHSQLLSYLFFTSSGAFAGVLRKTRWKGNKTTAVRFRILYEGEVKDTVTEPR